MDRACDAGPRRSKTALNVVAFALGHACERQIGDPGPCIPATAVDYRSVFEGTHNAVVPCLRAGLSMQGSANKLLRVDSSELYDSVHNFGGH